ncbi:MAG: ERCC4 domain-containing protein [Candidatus Micrarchaeaceae archaeon]
MAKLIIDTRERNNELISTLEELGVDIEFSMLDMADYVVSDRCAIERKTIKDFESSLIDGRLFKQAEMLKNAYYKAIIIIEGDKEEFAMNHNAITGAIISLYLDYGIQILFSNSPTDTAFMLEALARQEQAGKKRTFSPKHGHRAYTESQFMELMVGNLPGIGAKLAKNLLEHFGSVNAIAYAKKEELEKVDKIGKKKADRIYHILHDSYENSKPLPV